MKNILLVLMLSFMLSMVGIVASDNNQRFKDFESFKAFLMESDLNEFCKEQEDKFGSIELSAACNIVIVPFVALYHKEKLPAQASISDLVVSYSCYSLTILFLVDLYKSRDSEQKQDEVFNNFKNTYEECRALHKSIVLKNEQSKK